MRISIQSVLYGNDPRHIHRTSESVFTAARHASANAGVTSWEYRIGDCSPSPALGDEDLATLRESALEHGGEFSYEHFGANLGSAAGHNRLASSGTSDHIVFLNPDARVAPDCFVALIGSLRTSVGLVEARQIPLDHPKEYEEYTGDTSWASTACALTTRQLFESVEGFDSQTFFLYGDDVDYSWRVRLAGYRVVFEPGARVFHDKRLSIDGGWLVTPAEQYYSAEASLMLAHKYSNPSRVQFLLTEFTSSRVAALERAARTYRDREANGGLPQPIDPDHVVARFVGDVYAEHRF
ncbi:MAG: glycosyltransferase family 2 protein [Microbacterium sp.]|nr:MAG: glycosyltransferase family 2 protein [Microbacterium sp.]